jgi:Domain of unknown function (DUF4082)
MQRFLAVIGSLAIAGFLGYVAQVPNALSAVQAINLAPGDVLTINCSTALSGSPSGRQATFNCASNSTPTPTRTPVPGACPCSIFANTAAPIAPHGSDVNSVEVGVKFRADTSGSITGIRFYKLNTNTSAHVGHLWTATGTLLASATFAGESASGWQQVNLASPVRISASTTYVASYHTEGRYAADANFFSTAVDRAPLHAPANGVDGGNGVYNYNSAAVFPASTFNALNYWVDVVFVP